MVATLRLKTIGACALITVNVAGLAELRDTDFDTEPRHGRTSYCRPHFIETHRELLGTTKPVARRRLGISANRDTCRAAAITMSNLAN